MEQSTSQKVEVFTRLIERDYSEGSPFYSKFAHIAQQKYPLLIEQDIEDIYQNVLLRFISGNSKEKHPLENYVYEIDSKKRIENDKKLRNWFLKCLLNGCVDFLRHNKNSYVMRDSCVENDVMISLMPSSEENPLELLTREEERHFVRYELNRLDQNHGDIVRLIYFNGLLYREVSDLLGIPLGTVKSRLHTALSRLGERIMKVA